MAGDSTPQAFVNRDLRGRSHLRSVIVFMQFRLAKVLCWCATPLGDRYRDNAGDQLVWSPTHNPHGECLWMAVRLAVVRERVRVRVSQSNATCLLVRRAFHHRYAWVWYVCEHTCMNVCVWWCEWLSLYRRLNRLICKYWVCMYACMYVSVLVCVYVYIYV